MIEFKNTADILINYFHTSVDRIREDYKWKIPKIEGFSSSGKDDYQSNVDLKYHLNMKWHNTINSGRISCAKEIVADWGGIRANKDETLQTFIDEIEKPRPNIPFKGVASYSKIFAIANPNKYAIYDARVAACLNAIQYTSRTNSGIAFNYCSGRNNIIGNSGNKKGFTYLPPFKINSLTSNGWQKIRRDDTYKIYLELLHECLTNFPEHKLYDLEMILFANAEVECQKAMSAAGFRP